MQPSVSVLEADRSKPFMARRTFDYAADLALDRGQIFKLRGEPNDEKLIRLGYVEPLSVRHEVFDCQHCPAKFTDYTVLAGHNKFRHAGMTEHEQAERLEKLQSREQTVAPLYDDKTMAQRDPAEAARQAKKPGRKFS